MRFWESSAVVPLLVAERDSDATLALLERDPGMVVWWGTTIECVSAIARREREGALKGRAASAAIARLDAVAASWEEVVPTEPLRSAARRLLRVHALRAADALQLAAAIVAAEHEPRSLEFACLDERLNAAANREGFRVVLGEHTAHD